MQRRAFVVAVMDAIGVDEVRSLRRYRRLAGRVLVRPMKVNRVAAERFLAEFFDLDTLHGDFGVTLAELELATPMQTRIAAVCLRIGCLCSEHDVAAYQRNFSAFVDAEVTGLARMEARRCY